MRAFMPILVAFFLALTACNKPPVASSKSGGNCRPRTAPTGDAGEPVASLSASWLRANLKPATIQTFDTYCASLPDPVATVAELPVTRAMACDELMRLAPAGLPADASERQSILNRVVGFLADGLRVQSAVELAGLVTAVNDKTDAVVRQKREAHVDQATYESEIAKRWLSPAAHRWRWFRITGLRAIARNKGAADIADADIEARYDRDPSAMTDGDGNPLEFEQARPFLRDIMANERLREESRREMRQLLDNIDVQWQLTAPANQPTR